MREIIVKRRAQEEMVRKVAESVRDRVLQFVVLAISRSERHGTLAGKINVYNKNNQYSWGCCY